MFLSALLAHITYLQPVDASSRAPLTHWAFSPITLWRPEVPTLPCQHSNTEHKPNFRGLLATILDASDSQPLPAGSLRLD